MSIGEYGGVTKLKMSKKNPNICYIGTTLGEFHLLDITSCLIVKTLNGHASAVTDFVEIESRNEVVTAGEDKCCFVFDVTI